MKYSTFAKHHIIDADNPGFSKEEYSKFKFGDKAIARKFGYELADRFITRCRPEDWPEQIVVCSSPYCFIPTATFAMKDYFIQKLNSWLSQQSSSRMAVQETKIHRTITYNQDYGAMDADQRLKLIGGDNFYIDKEFIKDKMVLFMDDIRITGGHEKVMLSMAQRQGLENKAMFLYYASLENPRIHPTYENDLNYAFVKNLLDLDKIIKNDDFMLNTRVIKFILSFEFNAFTAFIQYQSNKLVNNIYHLALGNNYHLIPEYQKNLKYIQKHL